MPIYRNSDPLEGNISIPISKTLGKSWKTENRSRNLQNAENDYAPKPSICNIHVTSAHDRTYLKFYSFLEFNPFPNSASSQHRLNPSYLAASRALGKTDLHSNQSRHCCIDRTSWPHCHLGKYTLRLRKVQRREMPGRWARLLQGCSKWGRRLDCRKYCHHGKVGLYPSRLVVTTIVHGWISSYHYSPSQRRLNKSTRLGLKSHPHSSRLHPEHNLETNKKLRSSSPWDHNSSR